MISASAFAGFALLAFGMVLIPGPNMMYLVSRSVCQGRPAGLVSLAGVACAFLVYVLCTALGITAVLMAVPVAYDALRLAGALYLGYLAWQTLKPGGRAPFEVRPIGPDGPKRLFIMGFVTNLLNPKVAMLYLSLLPQFIDPARGSVLAQALELGGLQIAISVSVHVVIVTIAGSLTSFLGSRPSWLILQRWIMGTVFGALAVRLALDTRR